MSSLIDITEEELEGIKAFSAASDGKKIIQSLNDKISSISYILEDMKDISQCDVAAVVSLEILLELKALRADVDKLLADKKSKEDSQ